MSRCMLEGRSLYRLNDKDPTQGCHPVKDLWEADKWSDKQWGIFWTVNRFEGPRIKENCKEVLAWAIDIDSGSKEEQQARIRAVPLVPSMVYETARGFHLYFEAEDADPENYRPIVERMVEAYGGDKNAKDLCRILRVPIYRHWKGENPFYIKTVFHSDSVYSEKEMRTAFPMPEPEEKIFEQKTELRQAVRFHGGKDLWERIWNMDCESALRTLSGTGAVNNEMFSFKRNANGNLNILVNGKGTSCWIDSSKRIGSSDKGGPSIYQWINWYQRDPKRTVEIIKQFFPEVAK